MDRKLRNIVIVIILILLIVLAILIFDIFKVKKEIGKNEIQTNTQVVANNENANNVLNNVSENKTENNVENIDNNVVNENKEENIQNTQVEQKNEVQVNPLLSREEIAIELAKNDWGTTEGVYFTKMAVDANGYYVIFVNKSGSETSSGSLKLAEYRIDVDNNRIVKKKVSHGN